MEHSPAYFAARRHVERRIGFVVHLVAYVAVNSGLLLFNFLVVPTRIWSVWPLLGWGIGLLFHGLAVFLRAPGTTWKERMIEQELKKLQKTE